MTHQDGRVETKVERVKGLVISSFFFLLKFLAELCLPGALFGSDEAYHGFALASESQKGSGGGQRNRRQRCRLRAAAWDSGLKG